MYKNQIKHKIIDIIIELIIALIIYLQILNNIMNCVFCNTNPIAIDLTHTTLYCSNKTISDSTQCHACLNCIQNMSNIAIPTYGCDKYIVCPGCNSRILSYSYQNGNKENNSLLLYKFDTNENMLNLFSGLGGVKFSN